MVVVEFPRMSDPAETPVTLSVKDTLLTTTAEFKETVLPEIPMPFPAINCPAPENCVNVKLVVPNVTTSSVVNTNPAFPLTVPSDTKVNNPAVTSALVFASAARVGAPDELTV